MSSFLTLAIEQSSLCRGIFNRDMNTRASHEKMSEWWVIRYSRQREKLLQKLTHGRVCLVKAVVLKP